MKSGPMLHLFLMVTAFAGCILLPRTGTPVLLIPLWSTSAMGVLNGLGTGSTAILANGRIQGSIVVLPRHPLPLERLIGRGILPISVPTMLCGQRVISRGETEQVDDGRS